MTGTALSTEEIWETVDVHRAALADHLADLSDAEWAQPSLCDRWTVRDVVAHMSLNQTTVPAALRELARYRGNLNRMIRETARREARATATETMISRLRAMVGTRRTAPFVTHHETLIDVLVHSQDAMIPLNRTHKIDPMAAATAADRVVATGYFKPKRRLAGLQLQANDVDWSYGRGAAVAGPMDALLLIATGRRAGLSRLSGPGVATLAERLPG
jgi:uncharacterized protein (TIGR03083 family)